MGQAGFKTPTNHSANNVRFVLPVGLGQSSHQKASQRVVIGLTPAKSKGGGEGNSGVNDIGSISQPIDPQ